MSGAWVWGIAVFLMAAGAGYAGLPLLKRLHVGQEVRDEGPKTHLSKSGTPTFGGFFFLLPLFLTAAYRFISSGKADTYVLLTLLMLVFGAVGFADDYIKVRISKDGLSVKQKIIWLGLASVLFTLWYLWLSPHEPFFRLPLSGRAVVIEGPWKIAAFVLIILYLFYVSNAVNLADGVDGLCSSITIVCLFSYLLAFYLLRKYAAAFDSEGLSSVSCALIGGLAAFLLFNRHPARVFMGDTGSQALGAAMAAIPLLAGVPWIILFAGAVYIAEGLSTLFQVLYFKMSGGKRIFRMAPLHHHFELGGWSENKIVAVFSLAALIGGGIGLLLL